MVVVEGPMGGGGGGGKGKQFIDAEVNYQSWEIWTFDFLPLKKTF